MGLLTAMEKTCTKCGGTNFIANIAPACLACNLRKNKKTEAEYRDYCARFRLSFISRTAGLSMAA